MTAKRLVSAFAAALIAGATALIALYSQEGVAQFSDISQVSYAIVALGVIVTFLKDIQTALTK